jgi:hypothetical protein
MTRLARLRDCFRIETEPERVLFCTYGLEPPFFENEILPALFPFSLSSDRRAGSATAYLHAADQLAQRRDVVVLYDHSESGREFNYTPVRIKPGGFAFHPKLVLLDYGTSLRVVVTSANLTRSGWVSQFETFLFDDLQIGGQHAWAAPLRNFLDGLQPLMSALSVSQLEPFRERLALVKDGPHDDLTLRSTFDGSLLERLIDTMPDANAIEVVSPFFEGEEGPGIFDILATRLPQAHGRLFVRAQTAGDGVLEVFAPEAKIKAAVDGGQWSLHQVLDTWEGDDEGAPPRTLHGKLLALKRANRAVAMVGSPNLTRAALLHKPPGGNVEIAVLAEMSARGLAALVPQHRDLSPGDVRWLERDSDEEEPSPGPERWIEEAVYDASTEQLRLQIGSTAPPLEVSYEGRQLSASAEPPAWTGTLHLVRSLEVEVFDGQQSATIPFLIENFAALPPRGAARDMTLEEFLDVLAGLRESSVDGEGHEPGRPPKPEPNGDPINNGGAIAWRKIFRALDRIGHELENEAAFPRSIEYILQNPAQLNGLRTRLDPVNGSTLTSADHAFALHQLRHTLLRALPSMNTHPLSAKLVKQTMAEVTAEFEHYRKDAPRTLRKQLNLLAKELS